LLLVEVGAVGLVARIILGLLAGLVAAVVVVRDIFLVNLRQVH
jgi:hypothetical protein